MRTRSTGGKRVYAPSLLQDEAEFARICDDTVVNDGEFVAVVTKWSRGFEEGLTGAAKFFLEKSKMASRAYAIGRSNGQGY